MRRESTKPIRGLFLAGLTLTVLLAADITPRNPPAPARKAFNQAEKAEQKNRIEEARKDYQAAIALYPDYAEAWCELGLLQAEHDEFAPAMKSFRQAIRSDPKDICPFLPLAMLEHGAGDWNALVEVTDRMLRLDSIDYPLAHLLNGAGHYNLGEFDEAQKAARAAEALDNKNFPKMWEMLGWVSARKDNPAAATTQFQRYLQAMPADRDAPIVRRALERMATMLPADFAASTAPTFRVDTNLALVQFQVVPKKGELATALRPEDIEIREDKIPQKTSLFEGSNGRSIDRGAPVELDLLFDVSGSITSAGDLDPYVFQEDLLDEYENVSVAVYKFNDTLTRLTPPTRNARTLRKALDNVLSGTGGDTRLFGAIADTARDAASGRTGVVRKMVVFSDGVSGTQRHDEIPWEAAAETAREYGVAVYPVVLYTGNEYGEWLMAMESIQHFIDVGVQTGGQRFVHLATASVLPNMLKSMAKDVLPYTYVAGYYPRSDDNGKRHEAQVVLLNKDQFELVGGSRIVVH